MPLGGLDRIRGEQWSGDTHGHHRLKELATAEGSGRDQSGTE